MCKKCKKNVLFANWKPSVDSYFEHKLSFKYEPPFLVFLRRIISQVLVNLFNINPSYYLEAFDAVNIPDPIDSSRHSFLLLNSGSDINTSEYSPTQIERGRRSHVVLETPWRLCSHELIDVSCNPCRNIFGFQSCRPSTAYKLCPWSLSVGKGHEAW